VGHFSCSIARVKWVTFQFPLTIPRNQGVSEDYALVVIEAIKRLHERHAWQTTDGCRVSVGLIRVANIGPCMQLAGKLEAIGTGENGPSVYVCPYHARDLMIRRVFKEYWLDKLLKRKAGPMNTAIERFLREELNVKPGSELALIVVATPVEEVGRDHDFDWAIIEPSSLHSIIQTAGRVNRHRRLAVEEANIILLNRNIRASRGEPLVFTRPGLEFRNEEKGQTTHPCHDMETLLDAKAGEQPPLSTRLVFGDEPPPLARYDQEAIRRRLAPLGAVLGLSHPAWASQWFYEAYPLREREKRDAYRIMDADGKPALERFENGRWIQKKEDARTIICDKPPGCAWLCPSLEELGAWIEEKDLNLTSWEAFRFDLHFRSNADTSEFLITWKGIECQ